MNYGLILAGGVGQRMRNTGMPKQFLEVFGKPIIVYTLEKFEQCADIDRVIVACNAAWLEHLENLIKRFGVAKVVNVVPGGKDRQSSIENGVAAIKVDGAHNSDIVVIHDGVRPLVQTNVISENIRVAEKHGAAMTVKPVIETVVVSSGATASFNDFKKRDDTCSLTSPQTFKLDVLEHTMENARDSNQPIPILDMALAYASLGNSIRLVKDGDANIKITTPEDYYMLKAIIELQENRSVFGL